eukprot:5276933-Alexandrium_andersonii.AAC.1
MLTANIICHVWRVCVAVACVRLRVRVAVVGAARWSVRRWSVRGSAGLCVASSAILRGAMHCYLFQITLGPHAL